jgi:anti-sigma factor RsiW
MVVMRRTTAQAIHARRERSLGLSSSDCELMRLRASARLDDELSEADQAELAQHLDRCDACAQFAHALVGLTEVLRTDCRPMPPKRDVQSHMAQAVRSLVLLGALAIILAGGNSTSKNNHARCHSVWGVATVCDGRV